MNRGNPNRFADAVVFWLCLFLFICVVIQTTYDFGYCKGLAVPKQCASVPGQLVVSTTAEVCTYAATYGRATTKRRAG